MTNDGKIIVRPREFEMGTDVELYVQTMENNGILEKLSKEGNLNIETIKNMALGRMCDVFTDDVGKNLEIGDVIIFGDSATFEIFTGGAG